jgi:hypothetical protein
VVVGLIKKIQRRAAQAVRENLSAVSRLDDLAMLSGQMTALQFRSFDSIERLSDVEFKVSSQWGEDGIIEWLVQRLGDLPESFIEFGVENYRESNTRFLLQHRNWRGLVIDGSDAHVDFIRRDAISWRHDLSAVSSFITKDNINQLIKNASFGGEIGILSVDIDGMDYWVWEAIDSVNPIIIIAEYNSVFGDKLPLTIPYNPRFTRSSAHYSNLYYGLSIRAAENLANSRGYTMIGTNRAGSNVFFVRNDRASAILDRVRIVDDRPSLFREARDVNGNVNFTVPADRTNIVGELPVVDVVSGRAAKLNSFPELFSGRWEAFMRGATLA